ncbi:MAG: hypothetical protein M3500_09655 [Actinomycetota bacterium]|nr:hypothetical protein [Actinomycetota bacterium]
MARVSAQASGAHLARPIPVAPGMAGPPVATLPAKDYRGYDVEVGIAFDGSRYVVQRIAVQQRDGGPPVTTESLRDIPVAGLLRTLMPSLLWKLTEHPDGSSTLSELDGWSEDTTRHGPTDEALGLVAQIYRMAYICGDRPTKAVEDNLNLPRSTAGRWVALARERGFLGPAEGPGKAGG